MIRRPRPKIKGRMTPPPTRQIFLITFVIFMVFSFISFLIVNEGIKPTLLEIAKTRNEQYASQAMGIAVNKRLNEDLQMEELIEFVYNDSGDVVGYRVSGAVENRVARNIQYRVEEYLEQLEKGIVPESNSPLDVDLDQAAEGQDVATVRENKNLIEIPVGQILGLPIIANLGPKVPVKLEVIGAVKVQVETEVIQNEINNIHIEPVVHIEVDIQTIIPFATEPALIKQKIPLGSAGFQGDVPLYYNNSGTGKGQMPDVTIPLDPLQ